jgi:hypothetical protein
MRLMTPATTVVFVKAFENRCIIMEWNQGTQNATKFTNQNAVLVNAVKNYGQIDEATLKAGCEVFCRVGSANVQSLPAQNNHVTAHASRSHSPYLCFSASSPTRANTSSMG